MQQLDHSKNTLQGDSRRFAYSLCLFVPGVQNSPLFMRKGAF